MYLKKPLYHDTPGSFFSIGARTSSPACIAHEVDGKQKTERRESQEEGGVHPGERERAREKAGSEKAGSGNHQ